MKLLNTPEMICDTLCELLEGCQKISFAVAWATHRHHFFELLCQQAYKIQLGVVGLHFYQTSPEFLEKFSQYEAVGFILSSSGVFHPKAYVFEFESDYAVVLGSANMTAGALHTNQELCMYWRADKSDPTIKELFATMDGYQASCAELDEEWLAIYREKAHAQQRTLLKISAIEDLEILSEVSSDFEDNFEDQMSWQTFRELVQQDAYEGYDQRIRLLDLCQNLLSQKPFDQLEKEQRKLVAGIKNTEIKFQGWFGSLQGSGCMLSIVNENPRCIAQALEYIPAQGVITQAQFLQYIDTIRSGFTGAARQPQIPSFSRFLAMKRPDFFVSVNSKNNQKLRKQFNLNQVLTVKNYWELISRIHQQPWHNTVISANHPDYHLWKYRVAMLDAIYYEH